MLEKLETGEVCSLAGVPTSAQALVLAGWCRREASRPPCVVFAGSIKHQEELASDLEAWGVCFQFYPEIENVSGESVIDPDLQAERLALLTELKNLDQALVVTTSKAAEQRVMRPEGLCRTMMTLRVGQTVNAEELKERLTATGYLQEATVVTRGQFSQRGGILDVFSWHDQHPVRIEWFGDEVESLRIFSPEDQLSFAQPEAASILMCDPCETEEAESGLLDYFSSEPLKVFLEGEEGVSPEMECFGHDFLHGGMYDHVLQENRRKLLIENLRGWLEEGWSVWVSCNNEGEEQRFIEWLGEWGDGESLAGVVNEEGSGFRTFQSSLLKGFAWPDAKFALLTDAEIFGRYQTLRSLRRHQRLDGMRRRQQQIDFNDLEQGDYVVHAEYGVALYEGMEEIEASEGKTSRQQVLKLLFAESARLYVPLDQAFLVSKYVGVGKKHPPLNSLGGTRWEKAKKKAQKAVMDYAAALLRVQAERDTLRGYLFGPDDEWQKEFESSFLYQETPDQIRAIQEAKGDMEIARPMDRLICGDVGFGKTEVAIRAAFKAVMGGKQVAFLAPTTVLVQQHENTLKERMADYPIVVDSLSRFKTRSQQGETIRRMASGEVDIVVGTHRLISKDIRFKDLGLVIVDEEQRFGVKQKEKFKDLFRLVDVLTLSATPIPRTLYLALLGARDMSTIETPPPNRLSVETAVCGYDERIIRSAIERELARGGQVYFLHNRVRTIESIAKKIQMLVPHARVDIGHGQMDEDQLEEVMNRFVQNTTDVLVATTIIESGLDIPNANTIIIDRADRFGLADLYQLRGRVGRGQNRAYAILLVPRDMLRGDAGKRVQAIRQYTKLGSGYKIAMRDLEIRGAGNLLGTAQSGHIVAVGFELYCRLLKRAVGMLKGDQKPVLREVNMRMDFLSLSGTGGGEAEAEVRIPEAYMREARWRISAYRDLAELEDVTQWESLEKSWRDRFGRWPLSVELLLLYHKIRLLGREAGFSALEVKEEKVMFKKGQDYLMIGNRFPRLTTADPKSKLREVERWISFFTEKRGMPI